MELHNELAESYTALQNELRTFYNKGSNAAGTRARLSCSKISQIVKQIRADILEAKIARKIEKA